MEVAEKYVRHHPPRQCERSEAIQSRKRDPPWIVSQSLAMTASFI